MRYKIGEFSKLGKVSVKTLRHYDEEGILKPGYVDGFNRYRYYLPEQLGTLCTIMRYRRAGLSIPEIRRILDGEEPGPILEGRMSAMESERQCLEMRMELLEDLMNGGIEMEYEIEVRTIPGFKAAYRHGRIEKYSDMTEFVFGFAEMCRSSNPDVECTDDGYCFVTYDDLEYRESDIGLTYYQSVKTMGEDSGEIGFREFDEVVAACVRHVGPYDRLGEAYAAIMKWMSENGMELADRPRECYIDGCWNRESEDEYLTEIQFPIGRS
ncbi:MAG: GyrI-like domain-containing protein [Candidatus Methanomethylophilaceae archaeon]